MKTTLFALAVFFICLASNAQDSHKKLNSEIFSLPKSTSLAVKFDSATIKNTEFIKPLLFKKGSKLTELHSQILTFFKFDLFKVKTSWLATGKKDEYLFIFDGGFNSDKVEKHLRTISSTSNPDYKAIRFALTFPDKDKTGIYNTLVILDENTIAFGEKNFVAEYLKVFSKRTSGLSNSQIKDLTKISESNKLIHGTTLNFVLPENEQNNPVLKSLKQAEFHSQINKGFIHLEIAATPHKVENLAGISLLLNGLVNMQKQNKKKTGHQLFDELIYNSQITSRDNKLEMTSRIKLHNLELFIYDSVLAQNAAF